MSDGGSFVSRHKIIVLFCFVFYKRIFATGIYIYNMADRACYNGFIVATTSNQQTLFSYNMIQFDHKSVNFNVFMWRNQWNPAP